MAVTNQQFADKVKCHMSMASRLRSGERLPSIRLMFRISRAYRIPLNDIRAAYEKGEEEFSLFLKRRIFDSK